MNVAAVGENTHTKTVVNTQVKLQSTRFVQL